MDYKPRLPTENVNVSKTSPIKDFAVLLFGLVIIGVGVYFLLGLAVDLVIPRIPPRFEKFLAGRLIGQLGQMDDDSDTAHAVQNLLDRISSSCADLPYEFQVHIVHDPMINAVALPGGDIVVFEGLLQNVETENELAFVLSHEMGHYANRDHLKRFGRSIVLMVILSVFFDADDVVGKLVMGTVNMAELKVSRNQESRADRFGLESVHCLYGHVGGATDFFKKIAKKQPLGMVGHFLSTHPESEKRISDIQQYSREHHFKLTGSMSPLPKSLIPMDP